MSDLVAKKKVNPLIVLVIVLPVAALFLGFFLYKDSLFGNLGISEDVTNVDAEYKSSSFVIPNAVKDTSTILDSKIDVYERENQQSKEDADSERKSQGFDFDGFVDGVTSGSHDSRFKDIPKVSTVPSSNTGKIDPYSLEEPTTYKESTEPVVFVSDVARPKRKKSSVRQSEYDKELASFKSRNSPGKKVPVVVESVKEDEPVRKGFFSSSSSKNSSNNSAESDSKLTSDVQLSASVLGNHSVANGQMLKLRLPKGGVLNGVSLPNNAEVSGKVRFGNERVMLNIVSFNHKGTIYICNYTVFDPDGIEGIYSPGALVQADANEGGNNASSNVSVDLPVVGSVSTSILKRRVNNPAQKIQDNYFVILKLNEQ